MNVYVQLIFLAALVGMLVVVVDICIFVIIREIREWIQRKKGQ